VRRLAVLLLGLLTLAACGGGDEKTATPASSEVRDLANVFELRADFEGDRGKTRVLLVFSPT
jgi:hypothetical protein